MSVVSGEGKVLYIVGPSRTGSTVLENLIGQASVFFPAGEIRFAWERMLQHRWCGCRTPVNECPFWSEVFRVALAGSRFEDLPPADVIRWQRQGVRLHQTWSILRGGPRRRDQQKAFQAYSEIMARIYRALIEVTGASVIIDSSKRPASGAVLLRLPEIQAYFVHLVRDPRAVAYSSQRRKAYPEGGEMGTAGLAFSIVYWLATNIAAEAVCRRHLPGRSLFVRYEDYVVDPYPTLERIAVMVDESVSSPDPATGDALHPRPNHMISGNPSRFQDAPVELHRDDRWIHDMSRAQQFLITAATFPLLLRYGYPVRVKPSKAQSTVGRSFNPPGS